MYQISRSKNPADHISSAQFAEARRFEQAGLTSISQACKAFERGETERISEWRKQLVDKDAAK